MESIFKLCRQLYLFLSSCPTPRCPSFDAPLYRLDCQNVISVISLSVKYLHKQLKKYYRFCYIYVYYKNIKDGVLQGGITYRAVFPDGIPAGESAEQEVVHYMKDTSQVMYVTYEQE